MNEYPHIINSAAAPVSSASRLRRRLLLSVSTFAVALCYGGLHSVHPLLAIDVAEAAVSDQMDAFADLTPLSDGTLEAERGGFAVGNYNINVGVTVTTTVDGFAQVTTNISVEMPSELQNMGGQIAEIAQEAVAAANTAAVVADAINDSAQAATTASAGDDAAAASEMAAAVIEPAPQVVEQSTNNSQNVTAPEAAPPVLAAAPTEPAFSEQPQQVADLPAADAAASVFDAIAAPTPQDDAAPTPTVNAAVADTPVTPAQSVTAFVETVQAEPPAAPAATPAPAVAVVAEAPAPTAMPEPEVAVAAVTPDSAATSEPAPAAVVVAEAPAPAATSEPAPVAVVVAEAPAPVATPAAVPETVKPEPTVNASSSDTQKVLMLATSPEKLTQVIHTTNGNGHVSLVMNTLDNVLIQQTVSLNLTVENFRQVNSLVTLQKSISAISRQIGILSLRH